MPRDEDAWLRLSELGFEEAMRAHAAPPLGGGGGAGGGAGGGGAAGGVGAAGGGGRAGGGGGGGASLGGEEEAVAALGEVVSGLKGFLQTRATPEGATLLPRHLLDTS